jgi:type IV secretion system protein TrbJ
MNRRVVIVVSMCGGLLLARVAQAQWAVVDASNLIQTTLTAVKTAQTVANTYTQIELMRNQIQNQLQTLQSIDPRSLAGLRSLLSQGQMTYNMIRSDVDSVGFTVQDVNRDFDGLFPKDKNKWKTVKYSDYDNYYGRWNGEVTASSKNAERAQAALAIAEKNNQAIADILNQVGGATGEVRQLQLVNQQLAVIHSELSALLQNLAAMGRVMSNMAAGSAGEKMLTREAKARRRDGYTNLGRPARALQRLP